MQEKSHEDQPTQGFQREARLPWHGSASPGWGGSCKINPTHCEITAHAYFSLDGCDADRVAANN